MGKLIELLDKKHIIEKELEPMRKGLDDFTPVGYSYSQPDIKTKSDQVWKDLKDNTKYLYLSKKLQEIEDEVDLIFAQGLKEANNK